MSQVARAAIPKEPAAKTNLAIEHNKVCYRRPAARAPFLLEVPVASVSMCEPP